MAIDTFEFGHWPIPDTPSGKGQRHLRLRPQSRPLDPRLLEIVEASVLAAMGKNDEFTIRAIYLSGNGNTKRKKYEIHLPHWN